MTFTLLSILVVFLFVTIAFFEIYKGIKRGFLLSLVNLGTIAVSLFGSFAVTPLISDAVSGLIVILLKRWNVYQRLVERLLSLDALVSAILEMIISSLLFLLVFALLRAVFYRLFLAIYKLRTRIKADDTGYGREDHSCSARLSKIRGTVCGGISAFLITMIITSPVMGTLELASNTLSIVESASTKAISSIGKGNVRLVNTFCNDIGGNVFYRLGGRWIYSNAASAKIGGKRVYLLSEIDVIERMSADALKVYQVLQKPQNATQEHVEALGRMRENLYELESCNQLFGEAIRECSYAWKAGESFFGLRIPALHPSVELMLMDLLDACSKTTSYSAKKNADTILELYGILLESEIFKADTTDYYQLLSLLARHQTIEKIEYALEKNPNMDGVDASSLLLNIFSSCIDSLNLTEKQYSDFIQNITSALNIINAEQGNSHARKVREFVPYAQFCLAKIGMNVSSEITEMFSSELLKALPDADVTAANVKFIFEKYKNG